MIKFIKLLSFLLTYALFYAQFCFASSFEWLTLEDGLNYMRRNEKLMLESSGHEKETLFDLHIIQIDTSIYSIDLFGNFTENQSYSLPQWGKEKELLVALNASMYLPDRKTSTAYMKNKDLINNDRIVSKMSGFFLSKAKNPNDIETMFVEKSNANWEQLLEKYDIIVQNYRILGDFNPSEQKSKNMWKPSHKKFSISAYGEDTNGMIYFILSKSPTSVYDFAEYLLSLSEEGIVFKTVLYAEGGTEAGIYINTQNKTTFLSGMSEKAFFDFPVEIPNILGVRKK